MSRSANACSSHTCCDSLNVPNTFLNSFLLAWLSRFSLSMLFDLVQPGEKESANQCRTFSFSYKAQGWIFGPETSVSFASRLRKSELSVGTGGQRKGRDWDPRERPRRSPVTRVLGPVTSGKCTGFTVGADSTTVFVLQMGA